MDETQQTPQERAREKQELHAFLKSPDKEVREDAEMMQFLASIDDHEGWKDGRSQGTMSKRFFPEAAEPARASVVGVWDPKNPDGSTPKPGERPRAR
ncbi:hypothetical protein TeGR_g4905 [Tetraparma gracilis]|uniref:Uncharacterized protein n=1 Tax=Tetraparma gracilis TaxID=2962635 RepID=A0ABQ6ND11_9STRA|nr:hypothetical protein TeGR_g4905 [Tetraparma gracilis]